MDGSYVRTYVRTQWVSSPTHQVILPWHTSGNLPPSLPRCSSPAGVERQSATTPYLDTQALQVYHEAREVELTALGTDGAPKLSLRLNLDEMLGGGTRPGGLGREDMVDCVPIHGMPADARVRLSRYVCLSLFVGITLSSVVGVIVGLGYCASRLVAWLRRRTRVDGMKNE